MSKLQIADILGWPTDKLESLSEAELKDILSPLIPAARVPNVKQDPNQLDELLAKLKKLQKV